MKPGYLKIAFRYLLRHPSYSILSITGLTLAFAGAFLIWSHTKYQLGYDNHFDNTDRVFRLSGEINLPDNQNIHAILGPRLGPVMNDEIPAIEAACRLRPFPEKCLIRTGENTFFEDQVYNADQSVFEVFPVKFLSGKAKDALSGAGKAVISESMANKFFGKTDVSGNNFSLNKQEYIVAGVIEDLPENTHHRLDILLSIESMPQGVQEAWKADYSENYWRPSCFHFILLRKENHIEEVRESFPAFYEKHMAEFGNRLNADFRLILTPLPDVHFTPQYSYDYPKGNRSYIYLLLAAGIFLILIAGINYAALFAASLTARRKSTGIFRVNGAGSKHIYKLLICESGMLLVLSSIFAAFVLSALRNQVYTLTNGELSSFASLGKDILLFLLIIFILLNLILLFTVNRKMKNPPVNLLKEENKDFYGRKLTGIGAGSLVFQFSLSVMLILSSILVSRQVRFMLHSDNGFNPNNVVQVKINAPEISPQKITSFKNELLKDPVIGEAAFSGRIPGEPMGTIYFDINRNGKKESRIISMMGIDEDYIPLMQMEFLEGGNFRSNPSSPVNRGVILNEAGRDFLGLGDSIVGMEIENVRITGVLNNARFNSFHKEPAPVAFHYNINNRGYMNIRLNTTDIPMAMEHIKEVYARFFGDIPFEASFLDETVEEMYRDDINQRRLLGIFTLMCIFIANMGLYGLVSLISRKRIKEIGIRKVNGAGSWNIAYLLNRRLFILIVIAILIATPVTIYIMNLWLQNFALRAELEWWIIPAAGIIVLLSALFTISGITLKAANRNPVETLRYE